MLSNSAIESLQRKLAAAIQSFELHRDAIGKPELVAEASRESERLFQGIAKSKPSAEDAYAAALAFMRGHRLEDWQYDLIAGVLCKPIREQRNATLLGHDKLPQLLKNYESDAARGDLWWLTWYGLLGSYFEFPVQSSSETEKRGWLVLRSLLQKTWPDIDRQFEFGPIPDWAHVMRGDTQLLTDKAADRYGLGYLNGDTSAIDKLVMDLGIPKTSWFHHQLILAAVRAAVGSSDGAFKGHLPRVIGLIEQYPVFRDEAIELLLTRYHRCSDTSVHLQLRDYVIRRDIWRNPKLKSAGIATAWNRVPDPVWRMVLAWVNEGNLRDFFDILAARNQADHGRLAFWSNYLKQISWTRLVFGQSTLQLARTNEGVRKLIAREEEAYATLTANPGVDAFMMQIGEYIVVEFTKTPNSAYIYPADKLRFQPYARSYAGDTHDLKYGYYAGAAARIVHKEGWESSAAADLRRLGIYPDQPDGGRQRVAGGTGDRAGPSTAWASAAGPASEGAPQGNGATSVRRAPRGAKFTMTTLQECVSGYRGARIDDRRGTDGGRLWVEDEHQSYELSRKLQAYGFRWSEKRSAWYFPEQ